MFEFRIILDFSSDPAGKTSLCRAGKWIQRQKYWLKHSQISFAEESQQPLLVKKFEASLKSKYNVSLAQIAWSMCSLAKATPQLGPEPVRAPNLRNGLYQRMKGPEPDNKADTHAYIAKLFPAIWVHQKKKGKIFLEEGPDRIRVSSMLLLLSPIELNGQYYVQPGGLKDSRFRLKIEISLDDNPCGPDLIQVLFDDFLAAHGEEKAEEVGPAPVIIEPSLELPKALKTWYETVAIDQKWAHVTFMIGRSAEVKKIYADIYLSRKVFGDDDDICGLASLLQQPHRKRPLRINARNLTSHASSSVVVGPPGSGKSTLLKRLCQDLLAEVNCTELSSKHFIAINLREYCAVLKMGPPISLIEFFVNNALKGTAASKDVQNLIDFIARLPFKKGIALIDGWDEVPQDFREAVLLQLNLLKSIFYTIVTTRPSSAAYLVTDGHDTTYKIDSLSDRDRITIIERICDITKSGESELILDHLYSQPPLLAISNNPFLLSLLVELLAKTTTNWNSLINPNGIFDGVWEQVRNFHNSRSDLRQLGDMDYLFLQEVALRISFDTGGKRYIVRRDELDEIREDGLPLDGIIGSRIFTRTNLFQEMYSFIHPQIQEYFASLAILRMSSLDLKKLLQDYGASRIHEEEWRMVLSSSALPPEHYAVISGWWRERIANIDSLGRLYIVAAKLFGHQGSDSCQKVLGIDLRKSIWENIKLGFDVAENFEALINLDAEHATILLSKEVHTGYVSRKLAAVALRSCPFNLLVELGLVIYLIRRIGFGEVHDVRISNRNWLLPSGDRTWDTHMREFIIPKEEQRDEKKILLSLLLRKNGNDLLELRRMYDAQSLWVQDFDRDLFDLWIRCILINASSIGMADLLLDALFRALELEWESQMESQDLVKPARLKRGKAIKTERLNRLIGVLFEIDTDLLKEAAESRFSDFISKIEQGLWSAKVYMWILGFSGSQRYLLELLGILEGRSDSKLIRTVLPAFYSTDDGGIIDRICRLLIEKQPGAYNNIFDVAALGRGDMRKWNAKTRKYFESELGNLLTPSFLDLRFPWVMSRITVCIFSAELQATVDKHVFNLIKRESERNYLRQGGVSDFSIDGILKCIDIVSLRTKRMILNAAHKVLLNDGHARYLAIDIIGGIRDPQSATFLVNAMNSAVASKEWRIAYCIWMVLLKIDEGRGIEELPTVLNWCRSCVVLRSLCENLEFRGSYVFCNAITDFVTMLRKQGYDIRAMG